jgi:hypothetical protein
VQTLVRVINCRDVCRDDRIGSYIDVRIGDRIDVCRAVRGAVHRAVRRDDYTAIDRIGGNTADCRTFLVY